MNSEEMSLEHYLSTPYGSMLYYQVKTDYEEDLDKILNDLVAEDSLDRSVLEWGNITSSVLDDLPEEAFNDNAVVCPECGSRGIGKIEFIDQHYDLARKDYAYFCMACVNISQKGICYFNLGKPLAPKRRRRIKRK